MKPLFLWTERPQPIARELETHAWVEAHRGELEDLVELVYDNAPGDWRHYSEIFLATFHRAHVEKRTFLNLESDIVPTMGAIGQLLACTEYVCTVPYLVYAYDDNRPVGGSAVIETRVPGGWESHMARVGEPWANGCDLGLIRYSAGFTTGFDAARDVEALERNDGLLHERMNEFVRFRLRKAQPVHLHWPMLKNNHDCWDEGDQSHHDVGFVPTLGMLGKKGRASSALSLLPT